MLRPLTLLAAAALLLSGCAAMNNLTSEVSTFGPWPAERQPGGYVFERLPSQQAEPERQQMLETAARGAVDAAGFRAAATPAEADYLLQVGARVSAVVNPWIYNDPLFWNGGWGYGGYYGHGPFYNGYYGRGYGYGYGYGRWGRDPFGGFGNGFGMGTQSFEREVALVIRDRRTGQPLYEAHANSAGMTGSADSLLPAMFDAAMKDFPGAAPKSHSVTVPISPP